MKNLRPSWQIPRKLSAGNKAKTIGMASVGLSCFVIRYERDRRGDDRQFENRSAILPLAGCS
jgi:hypothetical protein